MKGSYDFWLVLSSYLVAVMASYVALELAGRIAGSRGRATWAWLTAGSIVMGSGIWSMHFIGMLAFHLPIPLAYEPDITLLSLVPAVLSAALVLALVRWQRLTGYRLVLAAVILGSGIAGMHYTGMAAIPVVPAIRYDPWIFSASVAVAIAVAFVALKLAFSLSGGGSWRKKFAAALVMGGAVSVMHYTGMAAAQFAPDSVCAVSEETLSQPWLAAIIALNTAAVLLVTVAIIFYDARLAEQKARMVEALQAANQALEERTHRAERAEQAAQESEARFRDLAELSSDWYWEQDEQLRYTNVPGMDARTGYERDSAIGKTRWELTGMRVSEEAWAAHKALLEARLPFHDFQMSRESRDGRIRHIEVSGLPIFDRQGVFRGYRGVGRDVTARVEAERALRESEMRFRDLAELSSDWYWEQDENLRFTQMSGGVLQRLGVEPKAFIGKCRWDFPIVVSEEALAAHKALLDARAPFRDFVYARRGPDGNLSHVSSSGMPLFDADGRFRGYRGVGRDITAQKEAELEILRAREQLQLALRGSRLALFEWNVATGEVFLSERWAEMIGNAAGPTQTTMDKLVQLVHPEDLEHLKAVVLGLLKDHSEFYEVEQRVRSASGGWIWVRTQGQVVERDAGGRALRASGTNADITRSKQSEEALRDAHRKLAASVALLERRNREAVLLSEMSNILLSSVSVEEACGAIRNFGEKLFPSEQGALFLMLPSGDRFAPSATWGAPEPNVTFPAQDCWALRGGRVHHVSDPRRDAVCSHALPSAGSAARASVCVPLNVQGQVLGVLWIAFESRPEGAGDDGNHEYERQLALTLSEQVTLLLSNIRLRENLRQQSLRDPLTGLHNRRFLEEALAREIARSQRKGASFALLMLDIDHFKRFNDTFGHDAGDSVLRQLALALQKCVRESDIVCRLGGEEFVVVLPEANQSDAAARARAILETMRKIEMTHEGQALGSVSVSIGLAMYPANGTTTKTLILAADKALYVAKHAGRDCLMLADNASEANTKS